LKKLLVTIVAFGCTFMLASPPAFAASGDLDPTFGGDGRVLTRIRHEAMANAVAIQPDGRIVVAGWTRPRVGPRVLAVARYLTDGSLDTTFGEGGIQQTAVDGDFQEVTALGLDGMDRIVVAGPTDANGHTWSVVRYDQNGTLDPSFGTDGRVTVRFAHRVLRSESCCVLSELSDMVLASDGGVLLSGTTVDDRSNDEPPRNNQYFSTLVRLDSAGSLDAAFGRNGKVFRRLNSRAVQYGFVHGMVLASDGEIVLGEERYFWRRGQGEFRLVRYGSDGSFDGPFGDVTNSFDPNDGRGRRQLTLGADGSILALGASLRDGAVAKYHPDGRFDASFSGDGISTTPFTGNPWSMAVQPDGGIIVVGTVFPQDRLEFMTVRIQSDGSLDENFGSDGLVVTKLLNGGEKQAVATDVAVQDDGRIVAVGGAAPDRFVDYRFRLAVVRLLVS
jgi:uncharacterized delta-60 repeat protein